jgi:hypothetical protein
MTRKSRSVMSTGRFATNSLRPSASPSVFALCGRMKMVCEVCEDEDAAELDDVIGRAEGMASWRGRKEEYNFRSTALPLPLLGFVGSATVTAFVALATLVALTVLLVLVALGMACRGLMSEQLARKGHLNI